MSPAALGNGTLPRGPLRIPEGDDSCDPCLPRNCTLTCPRLPASPPSLIIHAVQSIVGLRFAADLSFRMRSASVDSQNELIYFAANARAFLNFFVRSR